MGDVRSEAIESALARLKRDAEWHGPSRDYLVREAVAAGFAKMRIHELSGLSRATIDRILRGDK